MPSKIAFMFTIFMSPFSTSWASITWNWSTATKAVLKGQRSTKAKRTGKSSAPDKRAPSMIWWTNLKIFPRVASSRVGTRMRGDNLLMVADSDHDANMLYAVRIFVPDPFIYLRIDGKCHVVMSDLEIDRARAQAPHCRVLSLSQSQKALKRDGVKKPTLAHVIRYVLQRKGVKKVTVPYSFPAGLARELGKLRVRVKVKPGLFFPDRALKSAEEVKKISAALMMAEVGDRKST